MFKKKLSKEISETAETSMEKDINWLMHGIDLEKRRIEMRGEVGEGMASFVIRGITYLSEKDPSKPIQIIMSSPGGDAYEGLAIYDCIIDCPCEVNIKASGKIMSAGFVIYLAGKNRTASKHTTFMMHSVSYGIEGTAKEHEVNMNEGKRINNAFLDIAEKRTKRNKKWWARTILNHDRFFSATEALEIGIMTPLKVKPKVVVAKKKVVKRGK